MTERGGMRLVHRDLLSLSDNAYQRLAGRLAGLRDPEYLWEPAESCWSVRPAGDGTVRVDGSSVPVDPAPLTTIAWRVCHLIEMLTARRNATWLAVTPTTAPGQESVPVTAGQAIEALAQAYQQFRGHVAAADPAALLTRMGAVAGPYARSTRLAFVLHQCDELIHHGAEIGALRDLYRATQASP